MPNNIYDFPADSCGAICAIVVVVVAGEGVVVVVVGGVLPLPIVVGVPQIVLIRCSSELRSGFLRNNAEILEISAGENVAAVEVDVLGCFLEESGICKFWYQKSFFFLFYCHFIFFARNIALVNCSIKTPSAHQ